MSESISIYDLLKIMKLNSYEKVSLAKNLISEFNFLHNYENGKQAVICLVNLLKELDTNEKHK
jgi:hypothetical protein